MKKLFIVSFIFIFCLTSFGQTEPLVGPNWCGHGENMTPSQRSVDSLNQIEFQRSYESFVQDWSPNQRSLYVIPVVVHVVHLDGVENISDEQIFSAITILNEDFSAMNPGQVNVIPEFSPIIGDAQIEFRLATKDPSGNCHSGITRTYSATTYDVGNGDIEAAVEAVHGTWPQNKYLNIFVCKDPNGNAGYTNYPSSWYPINSMLGGIKIRHDYFGSIGTSNPSSGHVISHETGHWLNLAHCWGSTNEPGLSSNCDFDDGVTDTPLTIGWSGCFTSGVSCGDLDNVQNYMEYSGCRYMFTELQVARMHNALNSSTAGRNNLWSSSNLAATGVDGPGELCEAFFTSDETVICVGQSVQFYDDSYHNVTGRNWTFTGGSPTSSTDQDPIITFNSPGVYPVTLEVTDGTATIATTVTNYITVLANPGLENHIYYEGFETMTSFPDNSKFLVQNYDNGPAWDRIYGTGSAGSYCAWLYNYGVDNGTFDELISGTIDLSGIDSSDQLVFHFDMAYRRRNSSNSESLKFYVSKDCGQTWALRKNLQGSSLGTINQPSNSYIPIVGSSDWQTINVTNINSDYYVSNFRYKFVFENDGGNNIFIDQINLYPASLTEIVESDGILGLSVYPNPSSEDITIELNANIAEEYLIELYSPLGEKTETIYNGQMALNGLNKIQFNVAHLPTGIYLIQLKGEGKLETIKFIKE